MLLYNKIYFVIALRLVSFRFVSVSNPFIVCESVGALLPCEMPADNTVAALRESEPRIVVVLSELY